MGDASGRVAVAKLRRDVLTVRYTHLPSLRLGSKLHDMSQPCTSSPHKAIHHGFGVGVVFGLIHVSEKVSPYPVITTKEQLQTGDAINPLGPCKLNTGRKLL